MKTTTRWIKGEQFESQQEQNRILLDGDRKKGFSPKALLLAGLAGCSGIDVVEILQKMRVRFSELLIDTETTQTETHPKVFRDIIITYKLKADPADEEKIRKAINLSLGKYCGVSAMLKKNAPIHYHLIIE